MLSVLFVCKAGLMTIPASVYQQLISTPGLGVAVSGGQEAVVVQHQVQSDAIYQQQGTITTDSKEALEHLQQQQMLDVVHVIN